MTSEELKAFCKERNLTYKELAERIGMSEGGIKNALTKDTISEQTAKSIELLKRIDELENELKDFANLKELLQKITK